MTTPQTKRAQRSQIESLVEERVGETMPKAEVIQVIGKEPRSSRGTRGRKGENVIPPNPE